ncbi:MAG TPA: hypothetical protein VLP30_00230 [Desulfatirhabdiaceae bacterium]|nr:hypothetical protein [Desulfatirhabdiaceae bacterium]
MTDTDGSGHKKIGWQLIAIVLAGFVVGAALHAVTAAGVNNVFGAGRPRWLSYELMVRNAVHTPESFLALFGGLPVPDGEVVSKMGIYEAARLMAGLALLWLIPYAIHTSLHQKGSGIAFLASFALTALVGVFFIQITTTVPSMNDPTVASRYLVPSLVLSFILVLSQKPDWSGAPIVSLTIAAVAICFVTSAYPALVKPGNYSNDDRSLTTGNQNALNGIKNFLLDSGLHYGYATFWNSGVLSVLSDEKLLVRQIMLDHGLPKPNRWLGSNRWYRPDAWQGETFLLLTTPEEKLVDWGLMEHYHCKPVRQLSYEGFKVFVFPHNPAKYLSGWDDNNAASESLPASTESLHQPPKKMN